jgi:hypothetical protein
LAFVDDHVSVPGGEVRDVGAPGQRGQHRDTDDTGELASAAADLARSYAEELLLDARPLAQATQPDQSKRARSSRSIKLGLRTCSARSEAIRSANSKISPSRTASA